MAEYGLLVDYDWCTGCHSCEIACSVEHDYPTGQSGLKLNKIGPWKITEDDIQFDYIPAPTKLCDLCVERRSHDKLPTCVHHCQSQCIAFGTLEELFSKMNDKEKQTLYAIK
ncbi:oxidoreductase [Actinomycetota bacterium]|nr:oxidoreductase [Actinomycetota bacterium]